MPVHGRSDEALGKPWERWSDRMNKVLLDGQLGLSCPESRFVLQLNSRRWGRLLLVAMTVVVATVPALAQDLGLDRLPPASGHWVLKGENPVVIGGYGDNFSYDGSRVRPLVGTITVDLDAAAQKGRIEAIFRTTPQSGPIGISRDERLEGEIRFVQEFNGPGSGRIGEFVFLHGDSGIEAPMLPTVFNWLATWAPAVIYVNGEKKYELGGHFMYSVGFRREDQSIRKSDGTLFDLARKDYHGYTANPRGAILHVMAMSNRPDPNNFPPASHVLHVNFNTVYVVKAPPGSVPGGF